MIKASALYLVIVIALVVGVICSSLIAVAFLYNIQYQKKSRFDKLENNLNSGINLLLVSQDTAYAAEKTFSLFNTDADTVALKRIAWGIYDIGIAKAIIQRDTLFKIFSMANVIDSSKWAALYLSDENSPFDVSGNTTVRGNVFIPKAGVQSVFFKNRAYQGDDRLILGARHFSQRLLPELEDKRLKQLREYCNNDIGADTLLPKRDSVKISFLRPTCVVNFKKNVQTIKNKMLIGNLILFSDTTIIMDSSAVLKNVLVFAKTIIIKNGFQGNCQLFASDSISVGHNCTFAYPSCLGILKFHPSVVSIQPQIIIGENTRFSGIIFTYDKTEATVKPLISIEKKVVINGQVYSQGVTELKDTTKVAGSIFTEQFYYLNAFTIFQNYLVNTTIDSKALSPYYLTSELLPVAQKRKRILQWLEAN